MSQTQELERVSNSITYLVERFITERTLAGNKQFHMRELHDYIFQATQIAPASPDRILRQLRLKGKCNYKVLDRRASLYEVLPVSQAV